MASLKVSDQLPVCAAYKSCFRICSSDEKSINKWIFGSHISLFLVAFRWHPPTTSQGDPWYRDGLELEVSSLQYIHLILTMIPIIYDKSMSFKVAISCTKPALQPNWFVLGKVIHNLIKITYNFTSAIKLFVTMDVLVKPISTHSPGPTSPIEKWNKLGLCTLS